MILRTFYFRPSLNASSCPVTIFKKNLWNSNLPKVTVFLGKNKGKAENRWRRTPKKPGFSAVFLKSLQVWSPALDPCGACGRFCKDQSPVQLPITYFGIPWFYWDTTPNNQAFKRCRSITWARPFRVKIKASTNKIRTREGNRLCGIAQKRHHFPQAWTVSFIIRSSVFAIVST